MQEKASHLCDGGTACFQVIKDMGVSGISQMTEEQRAQAAEKVKAL
jgi:hypothetical protein